MDAVGWDFDFIDPTEREQELNEEFGRFFAGLFENVGNDVGDRGLKHHALGLEPSEVHSYDLARLKHPKAHPTLPEVKRK